MTLKEFKKTEFGFLASKRFWALVLIGLSQWLHADGYITEALSQFIFMVGSGFVTLNTLDKYFTNKK